MQIGYLIVEGTGSVIGLMSLEHGRLAWEAAEPGLAERATELVPLNSIPEEVGNPAVYAIRKLKELIPGESCVMAGNIKPDGFYKMYDD